MGCPSRPWPGPTASTANVMLTSGRVHDIFLYLAISITLILTSKPAHESWIVESIDHIWASISPVQHHRPGYDRHCHHSDKHDPARTQAPAACAVAATRGHFPHIVPRICGVGIKGRDCKTAATAPVAWVWYPCHAHSHTKVNDALLARCVVVSVGSHQHSGVHRSSRTPRPIHVC